MVPLPLQVWSQLFDVRASLLVSCACKQSWCCAAVLWQEKVLKTTELLHQAGMLALSARNLTLKGLAWCGSLVEPPVQLWCQAPHA